jgi:hypothetical protein
MGKTLAVICLFIIVSPALAEDFAAEQAICAKHLLSRIEQRDAMIAGRPTAGYRVEFDELCQGIDARADAASRESQLLGSDASDIKMLHTLTGR